MKVKIVNSSANELPKYETLLASGMDVRGDFSKIKLEDDKPVGFFFDTDAVAILRGKVKTLEIKPGGRCLIPTGLSVAIPEGYEIQCRMRSGLALKMGLALTNGVGTIDADYIGDIGIILMNTSNYPVRINEGDRLMQIVLAKTERIEWEPVDSLDDTERGDGGYGHTGVK